MPSAATDQLSDSSLLNTRSIRFPIFLIASIGTGSLGLPFAVGEVVQFSEFAELFTGRIRHLILDLKDDEYAPLAGEGTVVPLMLP